MKQKFETFDQVDQAVLKLCAQKRDNDDALGQCSDHEGDDEGPTFYIWQNVVGKEYEEHLLNQIALHQKNIKLLRKLIRLNKFYD